MRPRGSAGFLRDIKTAGVHHCTGVTSGLIDSSVSQVLALALNRKSPQAERDAHIRNGAAQ